MSLYIAGEMTRTTQIIYDFFVARLVILDDSSFCQLKRSILNLFLIFSFRTPIILFKFSIFLNQKNAKKKKIMHIDWRNFILNFVILRNFMKG